MQFLRLDSRVINTYLRFSPIIFFLAVISRTFQLISAFYFVVPIFLIANLCILFLNRKEIQFNLKELIILFLFPVYAIITSFWSIYPSITIQRSLYLFILFAGIYSIILLSKKNGIRQTTKYLYPANLLVILLSVFSLVSGLPDDSWTGGNGLGFMGFASHQNTLASALLFTLPGLLVLKDNFISFSDSKNTNNKVFKLLFILLICLNIYFIFISHSRAALLSLMIGILFFIILLRQKYFIILSVLFIIFILLASFLFPSFSKEINDYIFKDDSSILSRRMVLWEPSYEAAKNGGIIGLGYGVSDPEIKTPVTTGSYTDNGRYIREKGNSILAVIEETGLIGLILFLLPVFWISTKFIIYTLPAGKQGLQFSTQEKPKNNYTIFIVHSAFLAMLIHSQFEAWWVGPGSIQLPIYLFVMMIVLDS